MSGIEVAGIALAVFPILVDGMTRFVDGVQTIRYWRRYRVRLQDYVDIMDTQRVYYQDTLEELLTGIVQSEDEIRDLMELPRGAIWKKAEYEEKLRQRLGHSHAVYLKMADRLVNALNSMCEKLGIDPLGKLLPNDSSRVEQEIKRIKVTLSKNIYREILDTIDKANKQLRDITHQNIYLEPFRQKRRINRRLVQLKLARGNATSLSQVLIPSKAWHCTCGMVHMASLRLECRAKEFQADADTEARVRFRTLLSTGHVEDISWVKYPQQQLDIIPSQDKKAPSAIRLNRSLRRDFLRRDFNFGPQFTPGSVCTKTVDFSQGPACHIDCEPIIDICSTICAKHRPNGAIGFLLDEEGDKYKHYLYSADPAITPETRSKSLDDLLSCPISGPHKATLSRKDRLRIAVILASSILELDGTFWLKPTWNSKDILFHEKTNQASDLQYSYPYISWKLCKTDDSVVNYRHDSYPYAHYAFRSPSLFALGLTLIELCFGRTLAEMHTPEDGDPRGTSTHISTAFRLCNSVYYEMGTFYGDAVRRCLYQPFDVRDMSPDNVEFQQKVLDDIVTPLNDDLLNFTGALRIR